MFFSSPSFSLSSELLLISLAPNKFITDSTPIYVNVSFVKVNLEQGQWDLASE